MALTSILPKVRVLDRLPEPPSPDAAATRPRFKFYLLVAISEQMSAVTNRTAGSWWQCLTGSGGFRR